MKRIVICADGTWQSPESEHPTHVMRLARGIAPVDARRQKQVVFYDWGVGSEGDRIKGGHRRGHRQEHHGCLPLHRAQP